MELENNAKIDQLINLVEQQVESQKKLTEQANIQKNSEGQSVNLLEVIKVLLKKWWVIAICTVIGALSFFGVSFVKYTPTYTATAKMYVNNNSLSIGSAQVSITTGDLNTSTGLVKLYSTILKSYLVLDQVGEDLADQNPDNELYQNLSYATLVNKISCGSVDTTPVFYISVVDTDPQRAIDIANMITRDLPDQISTVIEGTSAKVVDNARVARRNATGLTKKTMIGAILGFVASVAVVFVIDYLINDTLTGSSWLAEYYPNIPILGEVPNVNDEGHGYHKYGYHYRYGYYKANNGKKEGD